MAWLSGPRSKDIDTAVAHLCSDVFTRLLQHKNSTDEEKPAWEQTFSDLMRQLIEALGRYSDEHRMGVIKNARIVTALKRELQGEALCPKEYVNYALGLMRLRLE